MTIDLRALIFDLDGVIADTNAPHYASWERLSQDESIPFSRTVYTRMMGLPRRGCLDVFLGGRPIDEDIAQEFLDRKNTYFLELLGQFTPADTYPGIRELIEEGRAADLKIGLGSSSANAKRVLKTLGLYDLFDTIGDGTTVARHKPAPDIFIWAAARLGVTAAQAIVFEDSEAGVAAGRAGKFWVVGIGDVLVTDAHIAVPSLQGIGVRDLTERLELAAEKN
ncbi:MAG: beta-phosphoglucomutase family hydrolase [Chloroflexota bacterium]